MYKVTLSMPIYNVAPYVERALLSALNQTFESIEFLLVDDRGTDNSMEIVHRIIKEHPRGKDVRIIEHPHNIGTGATKNTAIDNAQGEYLFFMDSDDEITPACIQVLYERMMEDRVDVVVASSQAKDIDGKLYEHVKLSNITKRGEKKLIDYHYVKGNLYPVYTWNKLYDLSFLKKNKIYCIPHHLCEDLYFSFNVELCAQSFSYVDSITYLYYIRSNSFMGRMRSNINIKEINMLNEFLSFEKKESLKFTQIEIRDSLMFNSLMLARYWSFWILNSSLKFHLKYLNICCLFKDIIISRSYFLNQNKFRSFVLYSLYKMSFVLLFVILYVYFLLSKNK